jgi:hypothetical protein
MYLGNHTFYNYVFASGTKPISFMDSLKCNSILKSTGSGGVHHTGKSYISGNVTINGTGPDTLHSPMQIGGNFTTASTTTWVKPDSGRLKFTGTPTIALNGNTTLPGIELSAASTIEDGGIMSYIRWLNNGIKLTVEDGTTITVDSLPLFGGAPGALDSLVSASGQATVTKPKDTVPYHYIRGIISTNGTYLPATSKSGGGNSGVYSLSYTGVTKDIATGPVGTVVTFAGSGFVGACWVKFGTDSSALTVNTYTEASAPVPLGLAPGVYAVSVGNGDLDQASVGNFTVTATSTTTRRRGGLARPMAGAIMQPVI